MTTVIDWKSLVKASFKAAQMALEPIKAVMFLVLELLETV